MGIFYCKYCTSTHMLCAPDEARSSRAAQVWLVASSFCLAAVCSILQRMGMNNCTTIGVLHWHVCPI